jgi:hypothetical protein
LAKLAPQEPQPAPSSAEAASSREEAAGRDHAATGSASGNDNGAATEATPLLSSMTDAEVGAGPDSTASPAQLAPVSHFLHPALSRVAFICLCRSNGVFTAVQQFIVPFACCTYPDC